MAATGYSGIAKVAKLLNSDNGMANGVQLLQTDMLADSMQKDATDRGLDTTGRPVFKYNNGFWAKEFTSTDGYTCSFYTPFMSGYGGITVAMMPNGVTYYYFSDNEEYSWSSSVNEANKLVSHCPQKVNFSNKPVLPFEPSEFQNNHVSSK